MTRWHLIKAVYGDPDAWRRACVKARDDGWTEAQVMRVLFLTHPITVIAVGTLFSMIFLRVFEWWAAHGTP